MTQKGITTLCCMCITAMVSFSPALHAGEDPTKVYIKKNGFIDTAIDSSSDGYMRERTRLVVNCTEGGCVETPAPNFIADGPIARNDSYSVSVNQAMNIISAASQFEPTLITMPLSDCTYVNQASDLFAVLLGNVGQCNERRITLKLPVLENDTAGPNGPINVISYVMKSVQIPKGVRPSTYRLVNNKMELTLYFDHKTQISDWKFNIAFDYTIKDKQGKTSSASVDFALYVQFSPLALDLDGDGVELLSLAQGVPFDINMDGTLDKISWVHSDDGLLALDRNGDGKITHRRELFGNLEDEGLANGFESLLRYDSNKDYIFDAGDKTFSEVVVWRDMNRDGVGTPDELKSLSTYGIKAINLNAVNTGFNVGENVITQGSNFLRNDGSKGQIVDVWFLQTLGVPPPKKIQ